MKRSLSIIIFIILLFFCKNVRADSVTLADIPVYSGSAYIDVNEDIPFFTELVTTPFDGYGPLDELGRATLAYACVGPETMPSYPRENINQIYPSGWSDAKYEGIDGGNLFNRCHLIGFQLTGQNANERNLITGTRYMNIEGMLPFENSVASYIEETGHHVMYRVTPMYEGSNLVASGVLMEAKSVEDPLVQFCAFCYNIQPEIEIDYATGESSGEGRIDYVGETASNIERLLPQTGSDRKSSGDTGSDYVLNINTKKFHYPTCDSVSDIKAKNREDYHGNRDEIIAQGYEPCKRCNP